MCRGYMATPEYFCGGTITLKSDIFSLGVIIMQIVFGQYDMNYSNIPSVSLILLSTYVPF
jgi:hypothetical protein